MKCPSCGAEFPSDTRNCPYCGSENAYYTPPTAQEQAEEDANQRKLNRKKFEDQKIYNKASTAAKKRLTAFIILLVISATILAITKGHVVTIIITAIMFIGMFWQIVDLAIMRKRFKDEHPDPDDE